MLAAIRRFTKTWPARLLFGLLVAAFGLWGVAGKLANMGGDTVAATVGGVRIEPAAVQRAYAAQVAQLAKTNGADFTPPPAQRRQMVSEALRELVLQTVLTNEIKRLGIAVPDAAVQAETFAMPAFKGPDGTFNRQTFLAQLSRAGYDEANFISEVRYEIGARQLLGAVGAGAAVPGSLVDQLFAYTHETRTAVAVTVAAAAASGAAEPTEAQLRRFMANHPALYTSPEYRRIKLAVLSPQSMAADMPVTDVDIRNYYNAFRATYDKPELRSVQVISAADQAAAGRLAATWTAGGSWEAMQAAATAAGATPIALAHAKRSELPDPALAAAAFAAAPNHVSAPIKGDFGWYVVLVTDVTPASLVTLAQAHDEIRHKIGVLKAADAIDQRADKVEDALAGGGGLDELPQGLGLAAVSGTLDAQGRATDGTDAPLPASPALRAAIIASAFAAKVGDPPQLQQLPTSKADPGGAWYALTVESITRPAAQSYAAVAERVRQDWTADQKRRIAEAQAAQLMVAARASTLADAAKAAGLAPQLLPPVPRPEDDTPVAGVPAGLAGPLFGMKIGDVTMVQTADGFVVAQLLRDDVGTAAADPIGAKQMRTALDRQLGADATDLYVGALQQRSKITVNDRVVQQIGQP